MVDAKSRDFREHVEIGQRAWLVEQHGARPVQIIVRNVTPSCVYYTTDDSRGGSSRLTRLSVHRFHATELSAYQAIYDKFASQLKRLHDKVDWTKNICCSMAAKIKELGGELPSPTLD